MTLGAYYRTTRKLRLSQLWWRARYCLERRRESDANRTARWLWPEEQPPRVRRDFPDVPCVHRSAPEGLDLVALLANGEFQHLNQAQALGRACPDWRLGRVRTDRLWTITLHYHVWAQTLAEMVGSKTEESDLAAALLNHYLSDWLARCNLTVPGSRELAWNAYAVATRIGWWVRTWHCLVGAGRTDTNALAEVLLRSLWQHGSYLADHLEWDLRGNHLLRNVVGLAWAGRFFAEPRARRWLEFAADMGLAQVREQVLGDGGHFERSPMYHLHVMDDVLTLAALIEDPLARADLHAAWSNMAEYLAWMRHPDGQIALFNDAALNGAAAPERMLDTRAAFGLPVDARRRSGGRHFPDSGIAVWQGEPWSVFYDVGPIGPDYQPGHAHADTLSLECSYQGRRLFVDPGTYAYDHDERRRYDRSTAAHNTVTIDDCDSSEVWHIFRVGRRAYPLDVDVACQCGMTATATHNGYDHLPGRPRHTRRVRVANADALIIEDLVQGGGSHALEAGLLVEPSWRVQPGPGGWVLKNGGHAVEVTVTGPGNMVLSQESRPYHPEFGRELTATRLIWRVRERLPVAIKVLVRGV